MPSLFTRIEDGKPVSPEHVRALQRQVQALSRSFGGIPGYVDSTGYHPRRQAAASGDKANVIICNLVATVDTATTGTVTIDGTSTSTDMLVLLTNQATPANNGVWKCNDGGAWTKQTGPYDAVGVIAGSANALTWWIKTAATPTYAKTAGGGGITIGVAKAASTANLTLSGAQTIDGVACAAGDIVLAKDQTTAADRGTYTVATGAWVKIAQPNIVAISSTSGTANGRTIAILIAANTYLTMGAVWR
jgi:dUTPase